MMLKSISIYGLFREYDYEIPLNDGSITYIHSQNGFGKSTIMRLIYNTLCGNIAEVEETQFDRMDLSFDDDTNLIVENYEDSDLLIQMQRNEVEERLTPEELRKIVSVAYISPERINVICDGCAEPAMEVYAKELTELVSKARADSTLITPPKEGRKEYSDDELEFWTKDLKAKLDYIKQANIEPDMPPSYRFPPTRFEIMEYRQDYLDLAFAVDSYLKKYYSLAESIIVYKDIVNNIFINKTMEINERGLITVKIDKNDLDLPLKKLSSGEKQIMVLFYRLLFQTAPGSLTIIDEPEISLHVSWQQLLGGYFKDVARLRDLRMIVATHAPAIIHNDWDMAKELRPADD